jgi:hypothetical protein
MRIWSMGNGITPRPTVGWFSLTNLGHWLNSDHACKTLHPPLVLPMFITDIPLPLHRPLHRRLPRKNFIVNIARNDEGQEEIRMSTFLTNRFFRTIAMSLFGSALGACTFEAAVDVPDNNPPPPNTPIGTLTQRWSIGGRFDARYCTTYSADRMQLVIRDQSGQVVARAFQPCEEMQMSVKLAPGSYSGDAWLIASDGTPVSTTLSLTPFQIIPNTDTFIDTNFPLSSLLTRYGMLDSPFDSPIRALRRVAI